MTDQGFDWELFLTATTLSFSLWASYLMVSLGAGRYKDPAVRQDRVGDLIGVWGVILLSLFLRVFL